MKKMKELKEPVGILFNLTQFSFTKFVTGKPLDERK